MEVLTKFLQVNRGSDDGYCFGYGSGAGYGSGEGYGSGYGADDGTGDGYGYGSGAGYGYGSGAGYNPGDGAGSGSGSCSGIKSINKQLVHYIDGIPTIIKHVHGNFAKGKILRHDLTITPCFVVKSNSLFAHGETLKEAMSALQEKIFDEVIIQLKNRYEEVEQ